MGFNSAFKGLNQLEIFKQQCFRLFFFLQYVDLIYNVSGIARCAILHSFQRD